MSKCDPLSPTIVSYSALGDATGEMSYVQIRPLCLQEKCPMSKYDPSVSSYSALGDATGEMSNVEIRPLDHFSSLLILPGPAHN
jgi:hypothetical protein